MLMGTSVLRNHWLNDKPYLPDGWFGIPSKERDGLTMPVESDANFLAEFKSNFDVSRNDESGLSVVVPWLSTDVTATEITRAVVKGYFYPILRKNLVVEIVDESGAVTVINGDTIKTVVEVLNGDLGAETLPLLALAEASLQATSQTLLSQPGGNAPKWTPECVPEATRSHLHARLEAGDVVSVRVPMHVRPKGKGPSSCFFDIFFQRDATAHEGQIVFIREGIIISDVRPRRTPGVRAIVVVDEGSLATFLGDAENPSHTQWQAELVREKYSFHRATIEYVVQSVPWILSILSQEHKKPETSLLIDLFSLPTDDKTGVKTQKKAKKKDGGETDDEEIVIPATPKRFIIGKRADGFFVHQGDPGPARPPMLAIKVAYGVRRGSPFAKYNPADFRLGLGGIKCRTTGCEIVEFDENWMLVRVDDDHFEILVTGFDTSHRDLHLDVKVRSDEADPEQALQEPEVAYAAAS
jgi:hypothetical protein